MYKGMERTECMLLQCTCCCPMHSMRCNAVSVVDCTDVNKPNMWMTVQQQAHRL
jgi:hypothetical protein